MNKNISLFLSLVLGLCVLLQNTSVVVASVHDHHDHHDHHKCVCEARELGVGISCTSLNMMMVEGSIAYLTNVTNKCNTIEACPGHYLILQAHHDFCPHDVLPIEAEKIIHDFEDLYKDCEIPRQYNPKLTNCPAVGCKDPSLFTNAVDVLKNNNCNASCSSQTCINAIRTVLMGHDTCEEDELPSVAEKALHDYEEACEDVLCNSRTSLYDPTKEVCPGDVASKPTIVKDNDDEVKLDVLIGVVCGIGAVVLGLLGTLIYMAKMEKKGKPFFAPLG